MDEQDEARHAITAKGEGYRRRPAWCCSPSHVSRYYWVHQHLNGTADPTWIKFIPDAHRLSG